MPCRPVDKPLWTRYTDAQLEEMTNYPESAGGIPSNLKKRLQAYLKRREMMGKMVQFLVDEHVAAIILPSRDGADGGGSGGTFFDDNGTWLNPEPYKPANRMKIPVVVMAIENFGRMARLLDANVPVTVQMDVETKFTGDNEQGYNTIAEIPGTDPQLKDQVVMVGGHLDSWIAGTGATDNGAGSVVAMEVMRILNALHVQPRRTIRIALWSGEEQGIYGSHGYVKNHFGSFPISTAPDQMKLPEWLRKPAGPLTILPEQKLISGYFNVDNGSGKIRGVYLQENAAVAPIFAAWIAPLKSLGVTTLTLRNTGGTDHLSFDAVGIPGFQFIQDPLDYETRTHHSNMDVYEELSPSDLKQAAVVEAIFVYNTAMRDQMLPRKPLPTPKPMFDFRFRSRCRDFSLTQSSPAANTHAGIDTRPGKKIIGNQTAMQRPLNNFQRPFCCWGQFDLAISRDAVSMPRTHSASKRYGKGNSNDRKKENLYRRHCLRSNSARRRLQQNRHNPSQPEIRDRQLLPGSSRMFVVRCQEISCSGRDLRRVENRRLRCADRYWPVDSNHGREKAIPDRLKAGE